MKNISLLLASIFIFPTTTIGDEIDYSKISEASSARIEKILVRYTRLFGEPCANIQILTPGDWQVIETERMCSFNGLSFETDFADAYFSDPKFSSDGVHLHLSLTPLEPTGEQKKKCFIPIKNKHIGTIECIASD